jgi:hypothetical protein
MAIKLIDAAALDLMENSSMPNESGKRTAQHGETTVLEFNC